MTLPLVALGLGTVVLGFAIGLPPDAGFLHTFLRPAIETCVPVPNILLDTCAPEPTNWTTFLSLAAVSVGAAVLGIVIGLSMYVRHRPDPAAVSRAAGPVYRLLVNKYFVDELYDRRIVDAIRALFGVMWAFDIHIIDGVANRLGWVAAVGGAGLRRAQTGVVGNYALTIVAGLLLILIAYGGYAAGFFER
jgi:NADH:ubiquinone oxidoreductase subunit 5 (subunit L)/multisubunit Na+/H+ antiporter MnhA subunit